MKKILALAVMVAALASSNVWASDNERYKAVPLGAGGASIFIIDTREGHMWVWTNQISTKESPNIRYEGNVRQHMVKVEKKSQPKRDSAVLVPSVDTPSSRF